jgi:hypothetical protein
MTLKRFVNSYIIENPDEFPKEEEILTPIMDDNGTVFKEYILNTLMDLKSKKKTITIAVGN